MLEIRIKICIQHSAEQTRLCFLRSAWCALPCLHLLLSSLLSAAALLADLLVVLLKGSEILTSLRELSLFHTLAYIPVHEGTLGVHQVEFVVETVEHLSDGGGVAQHAAGAANLSEIATRHNGGGLV